jgi:hypothetical protein
MNKYTEKLADIIEKNPSCFFNIDNDGWYITDREPTIEDKENEPTVIADSDNFRYDTEWYGHSSSYGFGITEALIVLLNRKGMNLKASAV